MNLIKLNVIGLNELTNRLEAASQDVQLQVQSEVEASAMKFVELAKKDLSMQGGNTGALLRSITYKKETPYSYIVSANQFYAPFIEFGTKTKFKPYPGTEEFASQYRGGEKRGDWMDMLKSIYLWVVKIGRAHV